MIRILHTADIHLGAKFGFLGDKASEHRKDLLHTFGKIIALAKEKNVNLLVIAGDFFDSNKVSQYLIQFVKEQFAILKHAGVEVCILPGTHDALIPNEGIYLREQFRDSSNVFVFYEKGVEKKEYKNLDLTVWGKIYDSNKSKESALLSVPREKLSTKLNIMLAHGSLKIPGKFKDDDWPFDPKEIEYSNMDYIALGHWHGTQDVSQGPVKAWYAGSPELTNREEKGGMGSGYVLIVEISDNGGKKEVNIDPNRVGSKMLIEEDIDVTGMTEQIRIKEKIKEGAGLAVIKIVNIKGLLKPSIFFDPEAILEELGSLFFHLKINMIAHIAIDTIDEAQYPKELIVGQYVRLMRKKIGEETDENKKRLLEEALQIGLAELEGKNIL
jgi:DNA repair exonuclease SbcCD nuclease subunit